MARMVWGGQHMTIAAARQTDLVTENTTGASFTAFSAVVEIPDHTQAQEDFSDIAAGQFGTYAPPAPGSKHGGSLKISMPLECLKSGYNPAAENPGDSGVISPSAVLLATALGSGGASSVSSDAEFWRGFMLTRSSYIAADVQSGPDTTVIKVLNAGVYTRGALGVWDASTVAAAPTIGWIVNTDTGPIPDQVTLFEAAGNAAALGDNNYGTGTAYLSSADPIPLTIHILGDNAAFKYAYIGCLASRVKLDMPAGKTPMVEIDFVYTDRKRYGSGGGLSAPSAFVRARPYLGRNGGRFTVDGAEKCGWGDFSVEVTWDMIPVECPGRPQGVTEVIRKLASVSVSATVPIDSGDTITSNLSPAELAYANGTTMTIAGYVGVAPGAIAAFLLPALAVAEPPQLADAGGLLAESLVLRPKTYTADAGSTAPADTVFRVAVA